MSAAALAQGVFFQRVAIATLLGLCVGFERQWRQRSAGLHTSTLVAAGAALFTCLPELTGNADTVRMGGQVVTGVGFLAGGVILRDGFNVRGLITAATLWATAAVGVLAGAGFIVQAAVGAVAIVATNLFCMPLADLISRVPRHATELLTTYTLHVSCSESARASVRERVLLEIATTSLTLSAMSSSLPSAGALEVVVEITKPGRDDGAADRLQAAMLQLPGVSSAEWAASERPA